MGNAVRRVDMRGGFLDQRKVDAFGDSLGSLSNSVVTFAHFSCSAPIFDAARCFQLAVQLGGIHLDGDKSVGFPGVLLVQIDDILKD